MQTQMITREDVIKLIFSLPIEKLVEVYDFANFLSSRPLTASFEYTEADRAWDKTLAETDPVKLQAWMTELLTEPGEVTGIGFSEDGTQLIPIPLTNEVRD